MPELLDEPLELIVEPLELLVEPLELLVELLLVLLDAPELLELLEAFLSLDPPPQAVMANTPTNINSVAMDFDIIT